MGKKEIIKKPLIKKKRKWYILLASKEFNSVEIGDTLSSDPSLLINRTVEVNLAFLTNDMKKQNMRVTFKVTKLEEDGAHTELVKYELITAFLKRLVKRDRSKIEDSFLAQTKDDINVRIKPLIVTKNETNGIIESKLRNEIRDFLIKSIKTVDYNELFMNIINHGLQNSLRDNIKKIYPIASSEIRILERLWK